MRIFESGKWYTVTQPSDLPTAEEVGDNRVMVQIWDCDGHEKTASYFRKEVTNLVYKHNVKRFVFFDLPAEEPDVCPVCGKKPNYESTRGGTVTMEYEWLFGCHRNDHEIHVCAESSEECITKWNALPRGGKNE